eukprot:226529-Prymnesium_polylepis.1
MALSADLFPLCYALPCVLFYIPARAIVGGVRSLPPTRLCGASSTRYVSLRGLTGSRRVPPTS